MTGRYINISINISAVLNYIVCVVSVAGRDAMNAGAIVGVAPAKNDLGCMFGEGDERR